MIYTGSGQKRTWIIWNEYTPLQSFKAYLTHSSILIKGRKRFWHKESGIQRCHFSRVFLCLRGNDSRRELALFVKLSSSVSHTSLQDDSGQLCFLFHSCSDDIREISNAEMDAGYRKRWRKYRERGNTRNERFSSLAEQRYWRNDKEIVKGES